MAARGPGRAGLVAVVGDVLTDVVVRPTGPWRPGDDTACAIGWRLGGAAATVAARVAGLGGRARLVGRVGADPAAEVVRATLDRAGVDHRLAVDPDRPSGTVVALVRDDERDMLTDRGASGHLAPADLAEGWLEGVAHLHLSGYVLLREGTRAAGLAALEAAVAAGVPISVDPASAGMITDLGAQRFLDLLHAGVLLTPNRAELAALADAVLGDAVLADAGLADAGLADAGLDLVDGVVEVASRLAQAVGEVAVTLGADGVAWTDGTAVEVMPVPGARARGDVDPLGAGDAFVAGLLVARLEGQGVPSQLRAGIAAALARPAP